MSVPKDENLESRFLGQIQTSDHPILSLGMWTLPVEPRNNCLIQLQMCGKGRFIGTLRKIGVSLELRPT